MKTVTKEEFYKVIGLMDVSLTVVGKYPYTTIFKRKYGISVGQAVDICLDGYQIDTEYSLY